MTMGRFLIWRRVHLASSGGLGLAAVAHVAYTLVAFGRWSPDAVWFAGAGLGLLLLGALNYSHLGVQPCLQPTTRLVRLANWGFLLFGISAAWAVPEPQAYFIVLCLGGQVVASRSTLPGPA